MLWKRSKSCSRSHANHRSAHSKCQYVVCAGRSVVRIACWIVPFLNIGAGAVVQASSPGRLISGVERGGMLSPFRPTHVTGPDRGTRTCPVCTDSGSPVVQVWVNTDDDKNVRALVACLEKATHQYSARNF